MRNKGVIYVSNKLINHLWLVNATIRNRIQTACGFCPEAIDQRYEHR
jgi:hypothetical protein